MARSRIRTSVRTDGVSNAKVSATHKQSRALLDLALGVICGKTGKTGEQCRIVANFVEAMLAPARGKSKVYLADLHRLDDEQFEQILSALRYTRSTLRKRHANNA